MTRIFNEGKELDETKIFFSSKGKDIFSFSLFYKVKRGRRKATFVSLRLIYLECLIKSCLYSFAIVIFSRFANERERRFHPVQRRNSLSDFLVEAKNKPFSKPVPPLFYPYWTSIRILENIFIISFLHRCLPAFLFFFSYHDIYILFARYSFLALIISSR